MYSKNLTGRATASVKILVEFVDRGTNPIEVGEPMKQKEQKGGDKKEMGGGTATPVSGLNENLDFMGKQLHIQTEKTGSSTVRIVTQVFCNGRVLLSRKTDHPSIAGDSGDTAKIRDLMNSQHRQIIEEIKAKRARGRDSR